MALDINVTQAALVTLLLLGDFTAAAQDLTNRPTFRTGVELVPVTVSVENADGSALLGLDISKFEVRDEGKPQHITAFYAGTAPIDLVIVLDTSASMTSRLETAKQVATDLLRALKPGDRAMVMAFGARATIVQPFSSDVEALVAAMAGLSPAGGTAMYDALYVALSEFGAQRHPQMRRRAIVVFSDGDDTGSLVSFDALLDAARRVGVATYTIRLVADSEPIDRFSDEALELRVLARETGADTFTVRRGDDLGGAYRSISRDLRYQYLLGFVPQADGQIGFRHVTIEVLAPHARVRARAGFIARRAAR
jgi:Ca-activated chloride channel family protein